MQTRPGIKYPRTCRAGSITGRPDQRGPTGDRGGGAAGDKMARLPGQGAGLPGQVAGLPGQGVRPTW